MIRECTSAAHTDMKSHGWIEGATRKSRRWFIFVQWRVLGAIQGRKAVPRCCLITVTIIDRSVTGYSTRLQYSHFIELIQRRKRGIRKLACRKPMGRKCADNHWIGIAKPIVASGAIHGKDTALDVRTIIFMALVYECSRGTYRYASRNLSATYTHSICCLRGFSYVAGVLPLQLMRRRSAADSRFCGTSSV